MPNVSVTESDFEAVACAAMDAQEAGHVDMANRLDRLARKINLALSDYVVGKLPMAGTFRRKSTRTWRDIPSTLTGDRAVSAPSETPDQNKRG